PEQGQVIIDQNVTGDQSPGTTEVTEGQTDDIYGIRLGHAPVAGTHVYVTVSAAMAEQEAHGNNGYLGEGDIIDNQGSGESVWLAASQVGPGVLVAPAAYDRDIMIDGTLVHVPARALVLEFDSANWNQEQIVHVWAPHDSIAEGDRTVAISHAVLSDDPSYNHALVSNVEVKIHDVDLPAVKVTQLDPFSSGGLPQYGGLLVDNNSIALEGDATTAVGDIYAIELTKAPVGNVTVTVNAQDGRATLSSSDSRFVQDLQAFPDQPGAYHIVFNSSNWNKPVLVSINAINDQSPENPSDTQIIQSIYAEKTLPVTFIKNLTGGDTITRTDLGGSWLFDGFAKGEKITVTGTGVDDGTYTIASLDSKTLTLTVTNTVTTGDFTKTNLPTFAIVGVPNTVDPQYNSASINNGLDSTQSIYARILDDETPGVFLLESGGSTLVTAQTASDPPTATGDSYKMRLTGAPGATVSVAIVTDGQTDINENDGTITLTKIGGKQPTKLFTGNIVITGNTITLGTGSELLNFINDGFLPGQEIRILGTNLVTTDYQISSADNAVTANSITLTSAPTAGTYNVATIDSLQDEGSYASGATNVTYAVGSMPFLMFTGDITISGSTITRSDVGSFVNDNFAPGEIIEILNSNNAQLGSSGAPSTPAFFTIAAGGVTEKTLTLTAAVAPTAGTYTGASINKMLDTLTRNDGTSWLDSGFLEGQIVDIHGIGGSDLIGKIDLITGTTAKKLDVMVLTDHPAAPGGVVPYSGRPLGGEGTVVTAANVTVTQEAAVVTFAPPKAKPDAHYPDTPDPVNYPGLPVWYQMVTVPLIG
ncbi:MAG TPA: hypothetical protein VF491_22815, partial [Vicinamibacterales bacterium]